MGVIHFHKYQGTGNDFVMIDDRLRHFEGENTPLIGQLCHRRFGIGADGVILLRNHPDYQFEMVYFNPDGSQSLCGNGSRCALHFANQLGMAATSSQFLAVDGPHHGFIKGDMIHIKMPNVAVIEHPDEAYFVNTGSPHYVKIVSEVDQVNVVSEGSAIRYSAAYEPAGTNVNFVEVQGDHLKVRTYERGVENETLSCGTGVTAVALALSAQGFSSPIPLHTSGGKLMVSFRSNEKGEFEEVYLIGPAKEVFKGTYQY